VYSVLRFYDLYNRLLYYIIIYFIHCAISIFRTCMMLSHGTIRLTRAAHAPTTFLAFSVFFFINHGTYLIYLCSEPELFPWTIGVYHTKSLSLELMLRLCQLTQCVSIFPRPIGERARRK
jgi:hypothetical protein